MLILTIIFLAFGKKNYCLPRVGSNPRPLGLESSVLSIRPPGIVDQLGKILCLWSTWWPMISLCLLNYRYDRLSQIPTLTTKQQRAVSCQHNQSGSQSELKNQLTLNLMVHFISQFQATSIRYINISNQS